MPLALGYLERAILMKKTTPKSKVRHVAARQAGELNATQKQAVLHGRSPLLIIAGAGTGKTLTLAHRGGPPDRGRRTARIGSCC